MPGLRIREAGEVVAKPRQSKEGTTITPPTPPPPPPHPHPPPHSEITAQKDKPGRRGRPVDARGSQWLVRNISRGDGDRRALWPGPERGGARQAHQKQTRHGRATNEQKGEQARHGRASPCLAADERQLAVRGSNSA
jgi:hypothetical protein